MTLKAYSPRFVIIGLAALLFSADSGFAQARASIDNALSGAETLENRPRVIVRYRDGAGAHPRRHLPAPS
jgi:hypothetical protein